MRYRIYLICKKIHHPCTQNDDSQTRNPVATLYETPPDHLHDTGMGSGVGRIIMIPVARRKTLTTARKKICMRFIPGIIDWTL